MAHIKPVFEPVYLVDFDFLGMLKLHDAEGIEPLLCPVGDGTYYSRGEIYTLGANPFGAKTAEDFSTISCSEASEFRENYLKPLLNRYPYGKKAFVIAEHMANLSGKVYYEQLQKAIIHKDYSGFEQAKQCLIDDTANIISIIERQKIEKVPDSILPEGPEILVPRIIECNNMAVLYVFAKNFSVPKDYKILNAGLGGIFIGPFFKNLYNIDWTNLLKSKYAGEYNENEKYHIEKHIADMSLFENKKVLFLDDNAGTGDTMREIKTQFLEIGDEDELYEVKCGAVQYNWKNYLRVATGEKTGINRFSLNEIDYMNLFNFPGHKLIKGGHALVSGRFNEVGESKPSSDRTPPGFAYEQFKEGQGYSLDMPGLVQMLVAGESYSDQANIKNNRIEGFRIMPSKKFCWESRVLIRKIDDDYEEWLKDKHVGPKPKHPSVKGE